MKIQPPIPGRVSPLARQPALFRVALFLCVACTARAQLLIDVGEIQLFPNQAGQQVQLFIENRGTSPVNVSGLSLNLQIAGGGPASEGGPGPDFTDGPDITGVDLLTGTAFAANNTGAVNAGSIAQFANWTTTSSSSFVSLGANTRAPLATVTFDTTGFGTGSWAFSLGQMLNGPTKYFRIEGANVVDMNPQILDGTLRLLVPVPEPVLAAVASACALLAWAAW